MTKKPRPILSLVSISASADLGVQQYGTVINNNIDPGVRAPSIQLLPTNLNVGYYPKEIKGFYPKTSNSGPHLTSYGRYNAITRTGFTVPYLLWHSAMGYMLWW